jgi:hypothetical protein
MREIEAEIERLRNMEFNETDEKLKKKHQIDMENA